MNAQERKERISDLIEDVKDLIVEIKDGENDVNAAINKANELDDAIMNLGGVDDWDIEEITNNILVSFLNNNTNFEGVQEEIEEFKNELEEYMSELSESKREKLEDKYSELETISDMLDIDNYGTIEDITEAMKEILGYLVDMK